MLARNMQTKMKYANYLWNSLPAELRDIQSLAIFKCKLKTYLLRAAFTT